MASKLMFCLTLSFYSLLGFSQQNISLTDLNDQETQLVDTFRVARVYLFLSPECPLCQSYSSTLKKLYEAFTDKGIEFTGVISGTLYPTKLITEYKRKYKLPFSLFVDKNKHLANLLHAKITPEVVVVGRDGTKLYSGRIDNWAYALGKKRKTISEHDLFNALEDILHSRIIKNPQTTAIGCFIE